MTEITGNSEPATLAQQLDFTLHDLDLNRTGRLSDQQTARLRRRRWRTTGIAAAVMLGFIIAASAFIFIGNRSETPIMIFVGIGLTVCSAALMGSFIRFWLRLHHDITTGNVEIISGKLERVLKPVNRRVMTYIIRIGEAEIVVNKETFKAFEHDAHYHLYRAPHSSTLLAAERTTTRA